MMGYNLLPKPQNHSNLYIIAIIRWLVPLSEAGIVLRET